MRILFLDTRPLARGAQVFLHDLSKELIRKNISVTKVYLYETAEKGRLELNPGDVILGGNDRHIFEKFPSVHPFLLAGLVTTIRNFNPDVIVLNGSRTLKYGAAAKFFLPGSMVMIYRVIDSVSFWNPTILKKLYYRKIVMPSIDGAIGVSKASLQDMIAVRQFAKPAVVIPRAIDPAKFSMISSRKESRNTLNTKHEAKIICFVGNLTPQKRPDRFISIVKELKNKIPDIQAWIIGDGPLMAKVKKQVTDESLQDNVVVWGHQKHVALFFSAADLLMLTSDTEGLPGVVLEAGYAGTPCIAADVGGIRECLIENETGYIVKKEDIHEFVNKAQDLLENESKRLTFGDKARQIVESRFTIGRVSEQYLEFFTRFKSRKG